MKKCTVAFATPARQWSWQVSLHDEATVDDALAEARAQTTGNTAPAESIVPWDARYEEPPTNPPKRSFGRS